MSLTRNCCFTNPYGQVIRRNYPSVFIHQILFITASRDGKSSFPSIDGLWMKWDKILNQFLKEALDMFQFTYGFCILFL
jgi:hypothetical protein